MAGSLAGSLEGPLSGPLAILAGFHIFVVCFDMYVEQTNVLMYRKWNMALLYNLVWICGQHVLFRNIFGCLCLCACTQIIIIPIRSLHLIQESIVFFI